MTTSGPRFVAAEAMLHLSRPGGQAQLPSQTAPRLSAFVPMYSANYPAESGPDGERFALNNTFAAVRSPPGDLTSGSTVSPSTSPLREVQKSEDPPKRKVERPKAMRLSQLLTSDSSDPVSTVTALPRTIPDSQVLYTDESYPVHKQVSASVPLTEPLTPPFSPPMLPPLSSVTIASQHGVREMLNVNLPSAPPKWNGNVSQGSALQGAPFCPPQRGPRYSPIRSHGYYEHSLEGAASTSSPLAPSKVDFKSRYGRNVSGASGTTGSTNMEESGAKRVTKRPYKKFYSNPTPSSHCHVCARTSKAVKFAVCARINDGLCRKVTCYKCFMKFGWDWASAVDNPEWICVHCRNECPPGRSQCYIYTRVNSKRESKRGAKKAAKLAAVAAATESATNRNAHLINTSNKSGLSASQISAESRQYLPSVATALCTGRATSASVAAPEYRW